MENKGGAPLSSVEELARMFNRTMANVMPTNIEQNETLWDCYAREWSTGKDHVKRMLSDVGQEQSEEGVILGEEWSDKASFD
jgi:hypothetical protein